MAVFRIKKNKSYTTVGNEFIYDEAISYRAKGILLYLLSRPDDWKVYEIEITRHGVEKRHAVRSAIQELIHAGYIQRQKKRDSKSRFLGYEYEVRERRKSPLSDFPISENHTLLSTEETNAGNIIPLTRQEEVDLESKRMSHAEYIALMNHKTKATIN